MLFAATLLFLLIFLFLLLCFFVFSFDNFVILLFISFIIFCVFSLFLRIIRRVGLFVLVIHDFNINFFRACSLFVVILLIIIIRYQSSSSSHQLKKERLFLGLDAGCAHLPVTDFTIETFGNHESMCDILHFHYYGMCGRAIACAILAQGNLCSPCLQATNQRTAK